MPTTPPLRAQISRILAAKCSLAVRVDALSDSDQVTIGLESRHKVEERIRQLEGRPMLGDIRGAGSKAKPADVYHPPAVPAVTYNPKGDSVVDGGKKEKKDKADKKSKKGTEANGDGGDKKKKKREEGAEGDEGAKKKKKKDK